MRKSIVTVGFDIAVDDTHFEAMGSKASLLDYDISLFWPSIEGFISIYEDTYLGKPCLDDANSFAVREACEHWRREIFQATEVGKAVIAFLPEKREIYVATGNKTTSGTGRNQKTTRHVEIYSNYNCFPMAINPVNAAGSSMKLNTQFAESLRGYWSELEKESKYRVMLEPKGGKTTISTKVGDKSVGAIFAHAKSGGYLLLLPEIDFDRKDFLADDGETYTTKARRFAQKFLSSIVELDRAICKSGERSVEPDWAKKVHFFSRNEVALRSRLLEAESRLAVVQQQKEIIAKEVADAGSLRALLFEKGKVLEQSIIDALQLLGFSAEQYRDEVSEFDVVFQCKEGRLLGEAEGKDSKAINVDKLRQLNMNIHEDLLRPEIELPAKGVLFGNGFRSIEPQIRESQFTQKCVAAATSASVALIATSDLFVAANYLLDMKDESYAQNCRKSIFDGIGIVTFPSVPTAEIADVVSVESEDD